MDNTEQHVSTPSQSAEIVLRRTEWIYRNLLEDGQLACLCRDKKQGNAIKWYINHDPDGLWLHLVEQHVRGDGLETEVINKWKQEFRAKGVCLGIYFGGLACKNLTRSIALDCDKDNSAELLPVAMKAFPFMAFFKKANGRWHAHGRLSHPVDARAAKAWLQSKLPSELYGLEVFPKTANDGKARFGNFIRLPMNPTFTPYEPVDPGLPDLIPVDANTISLWTPITALPAHFLETHQDISEPPMEHKGSGTSTQDAASPSQPMTTLQDVEHVIQRHPWLRRYVQGENLPTNRNSRSEFDWRFLYRLSRLGYKDPAFLKQAVAYRCPDKADNQHYIETTVANFLSRKYSLRAQVFHKPICPIRPTDSTQTWLYRSELWNHRLAGKLCRECYLLHFKTAQEKAGWDGTGWSPVYFLSVRTLLDLNCGALVTIRLSHQKLRLLGLLRLVRTGKGTDASRFRLHSPKPEDVVTLLEIIRLVKKQGQMDLLNRDSFARLFTEVRKRFDHWMEDDWLEGEDVLEDLQGAKVPDAVEGGQPEGRQGVA